MDFNKIKNSEKPFHSKIKILIIILAIFNQIIILNLTLFNFINNQIKVLNLIMKVYKCL